MLLRAAPRCATLQRAAPGCSMLHHAAAAGAVNLEATLMEILVCMRRAGADVIISYFTPKILEMIKQ